MILLQPYVCVRRLVPSSELHVRTRRMRWYFLRQGLRMRYSLWLACLGIAFGDGGSLTSTVA